MPDSSHLAQAGYPGSAGHLSGDAADHGNRYAAPRLVERNAGALRHASIRTTGDVYVQPLDESVARAVNSRTAAVLGDWEAPVEKLVLKGRNIRNVQTVELESTGSDCNLMKFDGVAWERFND